MVDLVARGPAPVELVADEAAARSCPGRARDGAARRDQHAGHPCQDRGRRGSAARRLLHPFSVCPFVRSAEAARLQPWGGAGAGCDEFALAVTARTLLGDRLPWDC